MSDNEAAPSADAAGGMSPGARLLTERRSLGLSLGDIARQLKLSVRQVEALERDDYAVFAGPVFVRGFLRNYARLLNLDAEELVAAAMPAPVAPPPAAVAVVEEQTQTGASRTRRVSTSVLIGGLIVIAVILLASNAARDKGSEAPANDSPVLMPPASPPVAQVEAPAAAVPAPAESSVASPETPAASASAGANVTVASSARPSAELASGEATAVSESGEKPHPLMSGTGPAQVRIVFEGESWVEVRDGSGATIFSRLNAPGTQRVIRGKPPLSLVVGNASTVKLSYHDQPVDLHPHTNTNADVARITLE
jgi:cytoskeleton protein RodZ